MKLNDFIIKHKTLARKILARAKIDPKKYSSNFIFMQKSFLKKDFSNMSLEQTLYEIRKLGYIEPEGLNQNNNEWLPRAGNLLAVLEEEAKKELNEMESKKIPSQNDLTRWALKDAVLAYYQDLNISPDVNIVENKFDERLAQEIAPDFDVIYQIWVQKLDELRRRNDKYALLLEEYDKAENDMENGMRGSAFEKMLDRYRVDFMNILWQKYA